MLSIINAATVFYNITCQPETLQQCPGHHLDSAQQYAALTHRRRIKENYFRIESPYLSGILAESSNILCKEGDKMQMPTVGIKMPEEMRIKCRQLGINISQTARNAVEKEIQAKELKS